MLTPHVSDINFKQIPKLSSKCDFTVGECVGLVCGMQTQSDSSAARWWYLQLLATLAPRHASHDYQRLPWHCVLLTGCSSPRHGWYVSTSQVVPQNWDFSCWTSQLTSLSAAGSFIGTEWRLAVAEGVWPVPLICCYHMSDGSSSTDRQSQVALQSIPFSIFQYHNFMTSEQRHERP